MPDVAIPLVGPVVIDVEIVVLWVFDPVEVVAVPPLDPPVALALLSPHPARAMATATPPQARTDRDVIARPFRSPHESLGAGSVSSRRAPDRAKSGGSAASIPRERPERVVA